MSKLINFAVVLCTVLVISSCQRILSTPSTASSPDTPDTPDIPRATTTTTTGTMSTVTAPTEVNGTVIGSSRENKAMTFEPDPSTEPTDSPDPFLGPNCTHLNQCVHHSLRGRKVDSERERNCACDQDCAQYGDCCSDSSWVDKSVRPADRKFTCVEIESLGGFFMITKCPINFHNSDLTERCEKGGSRSDPMASFPVTDRAKRITYRNIFCAMCHSDAERKTFWNTHLQCTGLDAKRVGLTEATIRENLYFDQVADQWTVNVTLPSGQSVLKVCTISPVFPPSVESSIRSCRPSLIETCPNDWNDTDVAQECATYQAAVYTPKAGYRNSACAMCNGVNVTSLKCSSSIQRTIDLYEPFGRSSSAAASFSILLDINMVSNGPALGKVKPCKDPDQVWDMFTRSCRSVVCGFKEYRIIKGRCLHQDEIESITINPESGMEDFNDLVLPETEETDFLRCPKISLTRSEFTFSAEDDTIYVPLYNRTFNSTNYRIEEDILYVCSNFLHYEVSLNKFSSQMGLVTLVGLGISIVSLVLHIIAFTLVSEVRNLSGQNLVCLSICLIIAYTSFIGMQMDSIKESFTMCRLTGLMVLYFFLASMAWMNVIAWDIWRTLRMATVELRVASGKQRGRFILYSLYAWTVSGLFVGAAFLADYLPSTTIPETIRPSFGVSGYCWFQRRQALILFFASPVAIIMAINLFMFILATLMIGRTHSGTKSITSSNQSPRTNYKLYLKLWLLMGLTWAIGFPASFLESLALWYIFIILNTSQGLFIFVAFSCKRKIIRTIKSKLSHLTSSSSGGAYSVATLSGNGSKLSESDLTLRSSNAQVNQSYHHEQLHPYHNHPQYQPPPRSHLNHYNQAQFGQHQFTNNFPQQQRKMINNRR